jgi:TRAP-type C4-dicarboxylate transport system permease small subunit
MMPKHNNATLPRGATPDRNRWSAIATLPTRLLNGALIVCVMMIFAIIVAQIVCRYFLDDSLVWGEEVSGYLMVWCGLLGAVSHFQNEDFMSLTVVEMLGWRPLIVVARGMSLVALVLFLLTLLVVGSHLVHATSTETRSAAANLPMFAIYACIPLFAALMLMTIPAMLRRRTAAHHDTEDIKC